MATITTTTTATATSAAQAAINNETQDMTKYGVHDCTCDGCSCKPIEGFRYKCTKCADHDICEACYAQFKAGKFVHTNKANPISKDITQHAFKAHRDSKGFTPNDQTEKQKPIVRVGAKVKPNDPCTCGSLKKAKKCCHAK